MSKSSFAAMAAAVSVVFALACEQPTTSPTETQFEPPPLAAAVKGKGNPPDHFRLVFGFNTVVDCGFFDDNARIDFKFNFTTFFDKDGNETKLMINAVTFLTNVNSVTGKTLRADGASTAIIDMITGEQTTVGVQVHIVDVGEGAILLDVGKVTVDGDGNVTFEAGPKELEGFVLDIICPLLA